MSIATDQEVKNLRKEVESLKTRVLALESPSEAQGEIPMLGHLANLYKQKFGKPPHHLMKPETIAEKLK